MQRLHDVTRAALVALSFAGVTLIAVSAAVWLAGGLTTDILGVRVGATDPLRPLWIGAVFIGVRLIARARHGFGAEAAAIRALLRPPAIAACLAALVTVVTLLTNHGIGGGADSFGYVSQADLWLKGNLTVPNDWLRDAPWPHVPLTAAPLGYLPAVGGVASVPAYPPGLPLLIAGAKWLFGQCGSVGVIAAMAGILVAATYGIGKRLASPFVGAAAAWITATSPALIFMMASPMSDVPAAAMTATAMYFCLRRTTLSAVVAGLSMGLVVLIRPNLAPLAGLFGLWLLVIDREGSPLRARAWRCAGFFAGVAPGPAVLALFNAALYGSPASSGYGNVVSMFALSQIAPNIRNYSMWMVESQTPLVALGTLALFAPARWLRKTNHVASVSILLLVIACVTALYLPYLVFDTWWYLRFFLPALPAAAVGTAWLCTNATGRAYGLGGLVLLFLVGGWCLYFAHTKDAFRIGRGDLRYVSAAHVVRLLTKPESVILSMQHSGTVTYYGGRRSLRYDWIEPHRLDNVVQWLKARNHDVYILLDDWEIENFRTRFAGLPLGALPAESLVFRQHVSSTVFLFDTRSHAGQAVLTIRDFVPSARRCCEPHR